MNNLTSDVSFYCTELDNAIHYYEAILSNGSITDIKIIVMFHRITLNELKAIKPIGILDNKLYLCWYTESGKFITRLLETAEVNLVKSKISSLYTKECIDRATHEKQLKDTMNKELNRIKEESNQKIKQKRHQFIKKYFRVDLDKKK